MGCMASPPATRSPWISIFGTMCDSFQKLWSNVGTGCGTLVIPGATTTAGANVFTQIFLNFQIYPVPTSLPATEPVWSTSLTATEASGVIQFNLANGPATGNLTCNLPSAYYPGDSQVTVDGSQFTYTGTSSPTDALASVFLLANDLGSGTFTQSQPTAAAFINGADPTLGNYTIVSSAMGLSPGNVVGDSLIRQMSAIP